MPCNNYELFKWHLEFGWAELTIAPLAMIRHKTLGSSPVAYNKWYSEINCFI